MMDTTTHDPTMMHTIEPTGMLHSKSQKAGKAKASKIAKREKSPTSSPTLVSNIVKYKRKALHFCFAHG